MARNGERATLSQEDKKKINELLNQENAVEFMESEKDEEQTTTGPPNRHIKPLTKGEFKAKEIT